MDLLFDIGGTKTRCALAREHIEPIHIDTPQEYTEGITRLVQVALQVAGTETIDRVIAGVPGGLSPEKDRIAHAPHLAGWDGHALAHDLAHQLQAQSVLLENDTALVGLGEAHYGAGKGSSIMVYITISTGVNGVRIVDGMIDRSSEGFEIGGQYLTHGEEGSLETFESLVSGTAIQRRFGVAPRELGHDHPVWEELAWVTAIGIHNVILEWSPDTVVLGGSMFNTIGISVPRVRAHLAEILHKFPKVPHIFHSELGDDGGLYGGLVLSKSAR